MPNNDPLSTVSPAELLPDGVYGLRRQVPGVKLFRYNEFSLAFLSVSQQHRSDFDRMAKIAFGGDLPSGPSFVSLQNITFVGTGFGRWLVSSSRETDLVAKLRRAFGNTVSITDQSHGYDLFDLTGPSLRAMLSKGLSVDADSVVLGDGSAVTTTLAHVNVTIWVMNKASLFRFAVPRSFVPAFMRFVTSSALEFGVELRSEPGVDALRLS